MPCMTWSRSILEGVSWSVSSMMTPNDLPRISSS